MQQLPQDNSYSDTKIHDLEDEKQTAMVVRRANIHLHHLISTAENAMEYHSISRKRVSKQKRICSLIHKQPQHLKNPNVLWPKRSKLLLQPVLIRLQQKDTLERYFAKRNFSLETHPVPHRIRISESPFGTHIEGYYAEVMYMIGVHGILATVCLLLRYHFVSLDKQIFRNWTIVFFIPWICMVFLYGFFITPIIYRYTVPYAKRIPFTLENSEAFIIILLLCIVIYTLSMRLHTMIQSTNVITLIESYKDVTPPFQNLRLFFTSKLGENASGQITILLSRFTFFVTELCTHLWKVSLFLIVLTYFTFTRHYSFASVGGLVIILLSVLISFEKFSLSLRLIIYCLTDLFVIAIVMLHTKLGECIANFLTSMMASLIDNFVYKNLINFNDVLLFKWSNLHNPGILHYLVLLVWNTVVGMLSAVLHHYQASTPLIRIVALITCLFIHATPIVAFSLFTGIGLDVTSMVILMEPFWILKTNHEMFVCCLAGLAKTSVFLCNFVIQRYGIEAQLLVSHLVISTYVTILMGNLVFCEIHVSDSSIAALKKITTRPGFNFVDAILSGGFNSIRVNMLLLFIRVFSSALEYLILITFNTYRVLIDCIIPRTFTPSVPLILATLVTPWFMLTGLSWQEAYSVGLLFAENIFLWRFQPLDILFRDYISLRWMAECWNHMYGNPGLIRQNETHVFFIDPIMETSHALPGKLINPRNEIIMLTLLLNNFNVNYIIVVYTLIIFHMVYRGTIKNWLTIRCLLTIFFIIILSACVMGILTPPNAKITCDMDNNRFCTNVFKILKNQTIPLHRLCAAAMEMDARPLPSRHVFLSGKSSTEF